MLRSQSAHLVPTIPSSTGPSLSPKQPYVWATINLSGKVGGVKALFDKAGRIRTLKPEDLDKSLFDQPWTGDALSHAQNFLADADTTRALGLQHAEFYTPETGELSSGTTVSFTQKLNVDGVDYRVRNGFVQVYMNDAGVIFRTNSSVRHGRKPTTVDNVISEQEAVEAARQYVGVDHFVSHRAELVMSSHKDRFDPCWEVTFTTPAPRRVACALVKGTTGEVVHIENKLRTFSNNEPQVRLDASASGASSRRRRRPRPRPPVVAGPVKARTFLEIPDPKKPLPQQVHDAVIASLPDPGVLKNENCIMYIGNKKREVKCKADGTFQYKPNEPEFAAVVTFFAYNAQIELMKLWGLKAPTKPMPIYVEDPDVRDNAYFDPENVEAHIGVGSGLPFGLTRYIAYDMGVTWHEAGHYIVFLQTPGNDLPGDEGGAIHESTGDVLGDLLMDWWFKLEYGAALGTTLTLADINNDPRIIGKFALPPNGIRIQKNKKRTPQDKTGEVHDDGLISGGAQADLLVAMINSAADIKTGIEEYGRLTLEALTLVPKHKVTFVDLLDAHLTADQRKYTGSHTGAITKAFGDHGIVLKKGGGRGAPFIVVMD